MNDPDTRATASADGHEMPINIQAFYPDHKGQLSRLAKIDGQIRGITRMIEERRYCIDIVFQIKAVQAARLVSLNCIAPATPKTSPKCSGSSQ